MRVSVDPERALALSYAPRDRRAGLEALFALDATLGQILRTTREPMVGQMRLTWWHAALEALDTAPPPAQPVLRALATELLPRGVSGTRLARMIDGWEPLLDETLSDVALRAYARGRGNRVFDLAGTILGGSPRDPVAAAGAGWALADLARNLRDLQVAEQVVAMAREAFATSHPWSRPARALGALAHSARMDLDVPLDQPLVHGSPARVARLAWHRLTGR